MTTSCWKEDPNDRPTVDYVLALLKNAAEQWEPKHRAFPSLSPRNDRNTAFPEESDSDTQLTIDEKVDQILDGARSPMGEDEVGDVVETLEMVSRKQFLPTCTCVPNQRTTDAGTPGPDEPTYEDSMLPGTREDLRRYDILPDSYIIPESKFRRLGDNPISFDGLSEVWPGVYEEGKPIAIKVIRYHDAEGAQEIKKVGHFDLFSSPRLSLSICRTFSEGS